MAERLLCLQKRVFCIEINRVWVAPTVVPYNMAFPYHDKLRRKEKFSPYTTVYYRIGSSGYCIPNGRFMGLYESKIIPRSVTPERGSELFKTRAKRVNLSNEGSASECIYSAWGVYVTPNFSFQLSNYCIMAPPTKSGLSEFDSAFFNGDVFPDHFRADFRAEAVLAVYGLR